MASGWRAVTLGELFDALSALFAGVSAAASPLREAPAKTDDDDDDGKTPERPAQVATPPARSGAPTSTDDDDDDEKGNGKKKGKGKGAGKGSGGEKGKGGGAAAPKGEEDDLEHLLRQGEGGEPGPEPGNTDDDD